MSTRKGRLGVGIRGAGQVAYEHLKAIEANPRLKAVAVCSRSLESARRLSQQATSPVAVYDSYEQMLEDRNIDVISECMPNYLHATEAIKALDAGKHLILEKPPAIDYESLTALRAAASRSRTRSVVSFVLRWHPLVEALQSLLARRVIGDVYYAEMDYWHGIRPTFSSYQWIRKKEFAGGAMITGGCHAADLVRYLTGREVAEVFAYRYRGREDFDYPTTLVAALKFADDSVGKLSVSLDGTSFPYQFNIDLLGTEGAIRDNRLFAPNLFQNQSDYVTLPSPTPNSGSVAHHPFQQEIDDLVTAIFEDRPVRSDVADACNSMEIALAVEESAATGQPIPLPRV